MGTDSTTAADVLSRFKQSGFEGVKIGQSPATFEVKKNNCVRLLARGADGTLTPLGPPYFIVRGLRCELEDRGYQKFWSREGKRFPIRLNDLKALHAFDEEVRALLGIKSLYHESLGSTSARSVYDRLDGRPDH